VKVENVTWKNPAERGVGMIDGSVKSRRNASMKKTLTFEKTAEKRLRRQKS
jgi:hypothetical protein